MTSDTRLRAATRGSRLARWQTQRIGELLGVAIEEVIVETEGDRKADVPIAELGGKGVFAKAVQQAVLDGRADIAVHSAKDLMAVSAEGLVIAAFPTRGDARDAMIGSSLADLRAGAVVATGSNRRRLQLAAVRPDLQFAELRGNVETRVQKAKNFDAVVLALVGLQRLGLEAEAAEALDPSVMVPQVGQGALAVECRDDATEIVDLVSTIDDEPSRRAVEAERAFLAKLGGGCELPAGAYATHSEEGLAMTAVLGNLDPLTFLKHTNHGIDPLQLGRDMARDLLDVQGGRKLLEELDSRA